MADKIAAKSEISDYFWNRQSKGTYGPFGYTYASIYKQTLSFTTFGDDQKSEIKMAVF